MSGVKPVNIQKSIEESIINEFKSMLEDNADDILLQELIALQKNGVRVEDIDLDLLVKKLDRQ